MFERYAHHLEYYQATRKGICVYNANGNTAHFEALPAEDLILIAEQLFLDLDAHEAADATSSAR